MTAYEINHLTRYYPNQSQPANDDISLVIEEGEFFGLLGDNGAGKTTLVKQMANLLKPSSGQVSLFGKLVSDSPLYASQHIGYMPQSGMALNNVTVDEALYFAAHLRGWSRADARQERDRLVDLLQLGEVRKRTMFQMSGGQKRLVALATCMAARPPIMILDEPTNDLAPQTRIRVWDILREANANDGTTVILVTHNVLEAEKVIQRVAIMKDGKVIAKGRPGALKAQLSRQLHLEVIFSPNIPPTLPGSVKPHQISPGRWHLLIERDEAATYINSLSHDLAVEDFRLSTATLEDLYLSMVGPA
ncbi:MAG: ABC transporter ATP-binding protein [Anaerolineaceae bacterium]|nr:ABC transporter ATP-binding protein [Anaerolineaceae bacterium]